MASYEDLKKGDYFLHRGEPYLVKRNEIVTVGTHCHKKNKVDVVGLFSGRGELITEHPGNKVEMLEIKRKVAQVISKGANTVQLMDTVSFETFDAEANKELQLSEGDYVFFVSYLGRTTIMEKA